jgi:ribosome-binding factor A
MPHRLEKINELIKRHVGKILSREVDFKPGVFVTVSKVDTTSDLRYTRVFVSIFPESEDNYVLETLRQEIYQIQGQLNKKLFMRPLPRVEFIKDLTQSKADEVEKILNKMRSKK